jgi:glycosyltransferase involved in cell wall biosynthesis
MIDKETLVTIVVPAFNSERYLPQCLQSLVKQTYENIEILLVDDGSTDGTGKLCDDYARRDDRIRVLHVSHAGVAAGRNSGVSAAGGAYLTFVDSDDVVAPDYISTLYSAANRHRAQISICDYVRYRDGEEIPEPEGTGEQLVFRSNQAVEAVYLSKYHGMSWMACGKMYDISLFRERRIQYPAGKLHEDMAVNYRLLYLANKVVLVNQTLYFYRTRSLSIMTKRYSRDRLCVMDFTREAIEFFLANNEPHLADLAANFHVRNSLRQYALAKENCVLTKEEGKELLASIRRDIHIYVDPGHLPCWQKAIYHLTAKFPYGKLLSEVSAK